MLDTIDRTSCHAPGQGFLELTHVAGSTAATRVRANSPLKLLLPQTHDGCLWAFTSTYGGGLVAGDTINLRVHLNAGTTCLLSTQASTKVYPGTRRLPCRQKISATVEDNAMLALIPDPITCFAGAVYEQRQQFHLAPTASLAVVDWLSCGRLAFGERWAFSRFHSRNTIDVDGQTVTQDAILLDPGDGPLDAPHRLGDFDCIATIMLLGPVLQGGVATLLTDLSRQPVAQRSAMLYSISPLANGAILRIAGKSTQIVAGFLRDKLHFMNSLLGQDPWSRKW